jgi:hypothetical protein
MPPLGGAQLSPAEVSAVAAYVWALATEAALNIVTGVVA